MRAILITCALISAAWTVILPGWWAFLPLAPWVLLGVGVALGELLAYEPRHAMTAVIVTAAPAPYGSMSYDAERDWLARSGGAFPPLPGLAQLEAGPGVPIPKTELINGHTWGCLCPGGTHHWTACPEDEDWPDDDNTPGTLPDMLPAGPPTVLVDAALALAQEDPEDAGWTDQLLADLHDAPTVLDGFAGPAHSPVTGPANHPEPSRLADTGEIELISLRAEYAAQLRAQDADAREFMSRKTSELAEARLHGLA